MAPEGRVAYHVCTSVISVVDAIDSLTLSVGSSPTSTSLSLEFIDCSPETPRKRTIGGEYSIGVSHTIVLGLPWVDLKTTKQRVAHCYPLRAPVNDVGDKFDSAPAGPGLDRKSVV